MKKEIRQAIMEGIKEAELNGYKWTITKDGLKWSYGEEFTFSTYTLDDDAKETVLTVKAVQSEMTMVTMIIGTAFWCDCSDLVDAYRIATEYTIRKANSIY
jgi:hypothetical protein